MTTITISRQFGAGGKTLGRMLEKSLGYRCVDEIMVREVAKQVNASESQVLGFEKGGGTGLMKFLDKFVTGDYINRLIPSKYGYVDEKCYVDAVRSVVLALHKQGNVIIVGRGSQYILKDLEKTYHILLVGELGDRIRFIADQYQMKEAEAAKAVSLADKNRTGFLSFFSNSGDHDNPMSYDLTLNMRRVRLQQAEKLVIDLISE